MKKSLLPSLLALTISSTLVLPFYAAADQPNAIDLVGKVYGGVHVMHIETDHERLMTADPKSSLDYGNGAGVEVGYRWLPSTEFRFSYSQFNLESRNSAYAASDGSAASVDMLYFPTEKNFYLLTGVNSLDIEQSQISANIGAGYRHYLNERMALYFETKAHYQFSEHYDDLTAQLGFVYFFGGDNKSQAAPAAAAVILDADNDGVEDSRDNCANTPIIDKVDAKGCTVFINDKLSIELLVAFDNNQAIVKPEYHTEIQAMADFLIANPETKITIEGHASTPGIDSYNKNLSQQRADAIVKILVNEYHINESRLTAIGYGESRLINTANTEAAHAQNRRIMATVSVNKRTAIKR
ncbi:OmpA family protein [Colwellia sp. D2M02]|uniref:OmpA family protein n=1 Tax=Colwellia sp. D2M02 TaxID=2841562 RepID=UPI001C088A04|nr:OmpA family protein [Colwellia sp. D2M02]MBU2895070.1 OmpA family protein [Colwellia sp. D2M02]